MCKAKVIVNGVNMLVMPEFRAVLKTFDPKAEDKIHLMGVVATQWDGEYNLSEVMNCTRFSLQGLQDAKKMLMCAIEEYDKFSKVA